MLKRMKWLCGAVLALALVLLGYVPVMADTFWQQSGGILNANVQSIAISPTNPQIIYAGTNGSIYKSANGGGAWNLVSIGTDFGASVTSLAVDPYNSEIVFAGTDNGVFRSTNGGISWVRCLDSSYVRSVVIDYRNSKNIYTSTTLYYVYKSTDGGNTWNNISNGLPLDSIWSLVVSPNDSNNIYAGTSGNGVYKSDNAGLTWFSQNIGINDKFIWMLAVDPRTPQTMYAGTFDSGVYKSTNGGALWYPINNGLTSLVVRSIAIDSSNPQVIYVATESGGIFKSFNGGILWHAINNGLTNTNITSLRIDPTASPTSQIVYAGTVGSGVFKSISVVDIPTISGPPGTHATVGYSYGFTPITTSATTFTSTGSIPPGLSLNNATGTLSGIPTTAGIYSNIIITASNAAGSASLPAFSITVTAASIPSTPVGGLGVSLVTMISILGYGVWKSRV